MATRKHQQSGVQKLLQIARLKADDLNVALASIRVSRNATETALAQLDHRTLQEQQRLDVIETSQSAAAATEQARNAFAEFEEQARINRANMRATLSQLDQREASLKSDLADCYGEMHKLEKLLDMSARQQREKDQAQALALTQRRIIG